MRLRLAVPLLLVVFAGGCVKPTPIGGKDPEKFVMRVVSLSPSTTEIFGMGEIEMIVGRTAACNWPFGVETAVVVVGNTTPDYEKIATLKPDLIVYDAALYGENDVAKMRDLGAQVFRFEVDSLADYRDMLYRLGRYQPNPMMFSEQVDRVVQAQVLGDAIPEERRPTTAVLIGGAGEWMIAGVDSFQADVVRHSGGKPIGPQSKKFETLNVEQFIRDAPEVLLIGSDANQALKDPRFVSLPAVRNKRVFQVDPDVLLRAGWRVNKLMDQMRALFMAQIREAA